MSPILNDMEDYERQIFHTDEVWDWAAHEYRFDLPGERFAVGRDGLNWLLVDDGSLRLIVDGAEVSPNKQYELYFVCGGACGLSGQRMQYEDGTSWFALRGHDNFVDKEWIRFSFGFPRF